MPVAGVDQGWEAHVPVVPVWAAITLTSIKLDEPVSGVYGLEGEVRESLEVRAQMVLANGGIMGSQPAAETAVQLETHLCVSLCAWGE